MFTVYYLSRPKDYKLQGVFTPWFTDNIRRALNHAWPIVSTQLSTWKKRREGGEEGGRSYANITVDLIFKPKAVWLQGLSGF